MATGMTVVLSKDGKTLAITVPVEEVIGPSSSGKTLIVASSHGNQATGVNINGKPLMLGMNAYIKP